MENTTISSTIELPEPLQKAVDKYIDLHPSWNVDRVAIAAMSLFLMQNGGTENREISRLYLDSVFGYPAA